MATPVNPVADIHDYGHIRWNAPRSLRHTAIGVLGGIAAVSVITLLAFRLHVNLTAAAFLHLVVVVLVARQSGFWTASIVSVIAVVYQLYFLVPPVLTWVVSDPQNWIALGTFEYCALIVSRLSGHAARQTQIARRRQEETEGLYDISRLVLLMDRSLEPAPQLTVLVRRVFHCQSVALFDAESGVMALTDEPCAGLDERTRAAYASTRDWFDGSDRTWFCVLRMGLRPVGALALHGGDISEPVARALASLVAVALERFRSFEKESRAEAARRNEQLRTAVLDALAHDVKTPLTAIRAASSGLLEVGALTPNQSELITLIDDEAGRLDEITNRLLGIAKLDEKEVQMHPCSLRLDLLIRAVVSAFEGRSPGHVIRISGLTGDMVISGDRELLRMGVSQLIDNAIKYSAAGSEIRIAAQTRGGEILLSVNNKGPVIPPADLDRIFERFYRAPGTAHHVPGTGLGLSITRKIAAAHSGRVWATSGADSGTTFFLALPTDAGVKI